MERDVLILTKSWKKGGFCVVGVDINTNTLVRLVSSESPEFDALSDSQMYLPNGNLVNVYDIVRVNTVKPVPYLHQTENVLISDNAFTKKIKTLTSLQTAQYIRQNLPIDQADYIFKNLSYKLNSDEIADIKGSLAFVNISDVTIFNSKFDDTSRAQKKMHFKYFGKQYKFYSITDPEYNIDASYTQDNPLRIDLALAIISLPALPFKEDGYYYKIVAKIIEIDKQGK